MNHIPVLHRRCSIRLQSWDYSSPGAYFVTVCTYQRELLLARVDVGDVVRRQWDAIPARFPSVELDEFIVMPNHVHGIIVITAPDPVGAQQAGAPTGGPTLGKIMRAFKSLSAIEANQALGRTERPFWQRNYWEHVVRDDEDLNRIRQYIIDNPPNGPMTPTIQRIGRRGACLPRPRTPRSTAAPRSRFGAALTPASVILVNPT